MKSFKNFLAEKKNDITGFAVKKRGGKEIIMEFALGAIAVALALVFRTQLTEVITTVGGSFSEKISALFTSLSS